MQNLLTGLFLIALATLAAASLFFHRLAPPHVAEGTTNLESSEVTDGDGAYVQAVVGYDRNPQRFDPAPVRVESDEDKIKRAVEGDGAEIIRGRDKKGVIVVRVKRGDTLASLARTHLGDANLWKVLLDANPSLMRPEDLQLGQELRIPTREAR